MPKCFSSESNKLSVYFRPFKLVITFASPENPLFERPGGTNRVTSSTIPSLTVKVTRRSDSKPST